MVRIIWLAGPIVVHFYREWDKEKRKRGEDREKERERGRVEKNC